MSVEAWIITPPYTISGTGPYEISHPYVAGAIRAYVQLDTGRLELNGTEFAVSPETSDTLGNLTLSPTVATTYAGRTLIIDRLTPDEQGWLATQGEREAGLAAQLDRMVQSIQELRARGAGALRIRLDLEPFDWAEGTVPIIEGGVVKSGPTATAIAAAQTRATEAAAAAAAAAASAAEALAKENSMLRDRGAWATLTLYSPSDIFTNNGTSYITQTGHIASSIAADQGAGRIRVFAAKGDAGAGTGDMLKTENLSGLTNVPQALTNLGLQALATKTTIDVNDIAPSTLVTSGDTLAANNDNNTVPTCAAVLSYVNPQLRRLLADKTVTGVPSSEIDFDEFNNALYRYYGLVLENVKPTTDGADLRLRFSSDGGITYDAGPANYNWAAMGQTSSGGLGSSSLADTSIAVTFGMGNASEERGATGELTLYNAGQVAQTKMIGLLSIEGGVDNTAIIQITGRRLFNQDTDAVRFLMNTGNIAVGSRIRMYGFN